MANLVLTQKAIKDLSDIWQYTYETWSIEQADTYYNMIKQQCQKIANGKEKGKNYHTIQKGLLGHRVGKHIIFYHVVANDIEIIRILHERMDYQNRISE